MIDIILPSIGRPTLNRAIDSVLNQTDPNWNLYIILDCPIGQAHHNILQYKSDKRINFHGTGFQHYDNGTYARNLGIDISNSNIITYIDDDDHLISNHIQVIIDILKENPTVNMIHTTAQCIKKELISPKMGNRMGWKLTGFTTNEPMLGGMTHSRGIFLKTEGWKPEENHDHVLWSDMLKAGGTPYISDAITYYFER